MGIARIEARQNRPVAERGDAPEQLPRLWPQLPLEMRRQIAQLLGNLLQRLQSVSAPMEERPRADHDTVG